MLGGIGPTGDLTLGNSIGESTTLNIDLQNLAGTVRFLDGAGSQSYLVVHDDVDATGSIIADADEDGAGDIQGGISIGELHGVISGVNLLGLIFIGSGTSTGAIELKGDVALGSFVTILGDYAGNIHADSDGNGDGAITGDVTIDGLFSGGDICGTNLSPGGPLPNNIEIPNFGCGATVCQVQICPLSVPAVAEGSRYLTTTGTWNACSLALRVVEETTVGAPCPINYVQADGTLGDTPVYKTPVQWRSVHIHGPRIVPSTTYLVHGESCGGGVFGDPTVVTTPLWGDTNNDGSTDLSDILCILDLFAGYPGDAVCNLYSGDLAPCETDQTVDVGDILAILNGFAGETLSCGSCSSGSGMAPEGGGGSMGGGMAGGEGGEGPLGGPEGGGGPMGGGSAYVLSLVPESNTVPRGGTVDVRAFLTATNPIDLRGYQDAVVITGGTSGTVTVDTLEIEEQRSDFVFFDLSPVTAVDLNGGRAAAALFSGGVNVGLETKYAATFTLRASSNARGVFVVNVRADTQLRDSANQPLPWTSAGPVEIIAVAP